MGRNSMGFHADRQAHPGPPHDHPHHGDGREKDADALPPSHCELLRLKASSTFSSARVSGSFSVSREKLAMLGCEEAAE